MEVLSYVDFLLAVQKIAKKTKKFDINSICGIPRGGLVPAVYLSYLTGLPLRIEPKDAKTLIIDDIADTGQTLKLHKRFKYSKTATIYYHKQSIVEPDIWIYEKKDDWILFPWETKESTKHEVIV